MDGHQQLPAETPVPGPGDDIHPVRPGVGELVDRAVDAMVHTAGSPEPGHRLIAELARRGPEAEWEAAMLYLGLLAAKPPHLPGEQDLDEARRVARTADQATALVVELVAVHRARGADPSHRTLTVSQL
ncbi:hypothetical protein ACFW1A_00965 [Kitasatospora sp. NPDC058965]|uniref:hypothetical protein n=1 Tax=Kitasatospora sp. NPDC058965 TaxID=3346682 RepID=UPI0036B5FCFE